MENKTVYCDGTFDLLHSGHINFFKKCRKFGNKLIVGVISDKNVESYKRLPIIDLNNRCFILEHIKIIDKVIKDCPFNNITKEFIKKHNIDIVIYASYSTDDNKNWSNHYKVPIELGIMKFIKYENSISSSDIIKKILCEN
jgi:glycerol-3-phosphate cytidylyltransferase